MRILHLFLLNTLNLLLICALLYVYYPNVSAYKTDDVFSILSVALALFSETLCFIILFRRFSINLQLLQFLWVFITCTTFYFYFINGFLWDKFELNRLDTATIWLFEVFVSITEGIILYLIMIHKALRKSEEKKIGIVRCLGYSFIFNIISTLFGFYISPLVVRAGISFI